MDRIRFCPGRQIPRGGTFLTSAAARELLRQEGITVIDYRMLQQAWIAANRSL
ncbi:hypothetical protein [Nonomuraea helvata]|uniref:Uncharacterized protein n=1 Tax=Nonomuraea helvata TaxID=37484 RepID=A0ABV5RRE2_9ACTN